MPTDYAKILEKANCNRYKIPAGWDSKETVAKALGCEPSRVGEMLKPAIDAGLIEKRSFPVYVPSSGSVTRVNAYRETPPKNGG